ncbi:MAG TPA: response regulator [Blastocatellia bacterium]|nr:response regulator [Blastocatellia bacterium]
MATLLVIERTAQGRAYLGGLVRDCGHHVLEAGDAEKGLELARRVRPDLVLANAFLGPMDGYDLVRRLRAHNTTECIPVVLFTSARDEWLARAIARASDVECVIERPGDRDCVVAAITSALEGDGSGETSPGTEYERERQRKSPARRAAGG